MPEPDASKIMAFESPRELNRWLEANHSSESELWIRISKKGSGVPSVTWNDVVIESLRWGWIDGIKKSLDDEAYLQRITPRKPRSDWSKRNTEHVEHLLLEGRMEEPGLVHVRAAKADGRWESAYSTSELMVPADFITALDSKPKAKQFYETLNKMNRNMIAHGLESAKKPETRLRRFDEFMEMLMREEKPASRVKKPKRA